GDAGIDFGRHAPDIDASERELRREALLTDARGGGRGPRRLAGFLHLGGGAHADCNHVFDDAQEIARLDTLRPLLVPDRAGDVVATPHRNYEKRAASQGVHHHRIEHCRPGIARYAGDFQLLSGRERYEEFRGLVTRQLHSTYVPAAIMIVAVLAVK